MPLDFKLPDLGEGIYEGGVLTIFVSEGDEISEGDPLLAVETDKAAVEIPSPFTGTVAKINAKEGDIVKVGEVLFVFSEDAKSAEKAASEENALERVQKTEEEKASDSSAGKSKGPVPASPATRKLARELNVYLADVPPTGPAGLVTADDVKKFAEGKKAERETSPLEHETLSETKPEKEPSQAVSVRIPAPALPDFSK